MVQNAYSYSTTTWQADIKAAQQIGIDGFALNLMPPDCQYPSLAWQMDRIDDAYTVAASQGFKLMFSFDMSWTSCNTFWNQTFMASMISRYASNSATYLWNNDVLVSTFGGDSVIYGNQFFAGLKNALSGQVGISLVPALTSYSLAAQFKPPQEAASLVADYPSIDGFFNWQAWPLDRPTNLTVSPDVAFKSALASSHKTGPYIMAVSPWQYKDLNEANSLNSWVAYSDTLFKYRWESAINKVQPDIIELLTWNDYGESHYLRNLPPASETGPASVRLGEMGKYVYGTDHSGWRIMAKYYIAWYKTGTPPAIEQDQVVFWYRTHPKNAACNLGLASSIRNSEYPHDAVFAWALVCSPATISVSVGSNEYWTFEANSTGPAIGSVPFPDDLGSGVIPMVGIVRDGKTVQAANGTQTITSGCDFVNFNPVVGVAGPHLSSWGVDSVLVG
ncbi:hypothetical protein LTR04_002734 [Oleoguttula sp. CCFEE 6159]|nr:hypothetical protein LTR04_002734 [Oleoguttula sp. CCFEE 6159]